MRKIFVVLLLALILTPLFARGTVETISDGGLQGVFNTIKELYGLEPELSEPAVAEPETEAEVNAPELEIEAVAEVKVEVEAQPALDVPFFETLFSYLGVESYVTISDIEATFTLPEGTTEDQLTEFLSLLVSKYPYFAEARILVSDSLLLVDYPQMDREVLLSTYSLVESVAKDYIDYLVALLKAKLEEAEPAIEQPAEEPVVEEPVAEVPAVEENATQQQAEVAPQKQPATEAVSPEVSVQEEVYKTDFAHRGIKTDIEAYKDRAYVYVPLGVTLQDVKSVVAFLRTNNELFKKTDYTLDGAKVIFTYPTQKLETVKAGVDVFKGLLVQYIDELFDSLEAQTTTTKKSSSSSSFTFGLSAGIKGLVKHEKGSTFIFPTLSANLRYAGKFLYGEIGGEYILFKQSNYLFTVGAVKANVGVTLKNEVIGVFAYFGGRYVIATEKSGFKTGIIQSYGGGFELNFSKKVGFTAFYEKSGDVSYYNLSVGLKF